MDHHGTTSALVLRVLLVALAICFLLGAISHAGVRLPIGVAVIDEPTIVPAAIVESVVAAAFVAAAVAEFTRSPLARIVVPLALRVGIAGVLLGMFALAMGRGTRTELNDVFHVVALAAMVLALPLTGSGAGRRACRPGAGAARRAT